MKIQNIVHLSKPSIREYDFPLCGFLQIGSVREFFTNKLLAASRNSFTRNPKAVTCRYCKDEMKLLSDDELMGVKP